MTKAEFREEHPYLSDLINYAYENDIYSVTEDLIYGDELNERVEDEIRDFLENSYWTNLSGYLDDISTGFDYYRRGDGWFDYRGLDEDDYEEIFELIMDEIEDDLDPEEDNEEEEISALSEEQVAGLFSLSSGILKSLKEQELR